MDIAGLSPLSPPEAQPPERSGRAPTRAGTPAARHGRAYRPQLLQTRRSPVQHRAPPQARTPGPAAERARVLRAAAHAPWQPSSEGLAASAAAVRAAVLSAADAPQGAPTDGPPQGGANSGRSERGAQRSAARYRTLAADSPPAPRVDLLA